MAMRGTHEKPAPIPFYGLIFPDKERNGRWIVICRCLGQKQDMDMDTDLWKVLNAIIHTFQCNELPVHSGAD